MKPNRNFVVEYKTNRRPLKTQTNSIWGNTDLKALVEEIESETSFPSGAPLPLEPPSVGCPDIPLEPAPSVPVFDDVGPTDSQDQAKSQNKDTAEAPPATEPSVRPTGDAAPKSKPPRAEGNNTRRPNVIAAAGPTASMPETAINVGLARADIVTPADLATLEAENRRLRAMLTEKLRAENARLIAMLQRFGIA
ncbi:hypothetical protein QD357_15475 [Rhizobium sp. BR 317]|uniref:hypothetical protein n=1 Tax=Rhizobium sp. BR 317 TaxID=3040015 RepID=UPI0039BFA092